MPPRQAQLTGITQLNFGSDTEIVAKRVERLTKTQLDLDGFGPWLGKIAIRLDELQFSSLNQGHIIQFNNAISMLQMVDAAIPPMPQKEPKVNCEDIKGEKGLLPKDLSARLRSVDAKLKEYEPRSREIAKKTSDIESAHAAADQLPTDLAELAEKKEELQKIIEDAGELARKISESSDAVEAARIQVEFDAKISQEKIDSTTINADAVLKKVNMRFGALLPLVSLKHLSLNERRFLKLACGG